MATLRSTMNAPLTDEEENEILDAWQRLTAQAHMLGMWNQDQQLMLEQAADLVGLVSELRSAIHNAWHYANRRAFPAPEAPRRKHTLNLYKGDYDKVRQMHDVLKNYSPEEIAEALKSMELDK